jgi:hypothetical protein
MNGGKKCRQLVYDGLLHLIAGEAARDEDAAEKFIRINFPYACEP